MIMYAIYKRFSKPAITIGVYRVYNNKIGSARNEFEKLVAGLLEAPTIIITLI
jgi:hypothetical protein